MENMSNYSDGNGNDNNSYRDESHFKGCLCGHHHEHSSHEVKNGMEVFIGLGVIALLFGVAVSTNYYLNPEQDNVKPKIEQRQVSPSRLESNLVPKIKLDRN